MRLLPGYNSSFMGFAPADDPRYVVAVSVLNPRNGNSGGALAGPVFADVMRFTLAHMGVAPTGLKDRSSRCSPSDQAGSRPRYRNDRQPSRSMP